MSPKLKIASEVLSEACSFLLSGYTPFCGLGLFHLFSTFEEFVLCPVLKQQHKISADSSGRLLG